MSTQPGTLIALAGLPGSGKTTLARLLAQELRAVHLRIDSIEQAIIAAGVLRGPEGYAVGCAVAKDNLRLGHIVIADSVNPLAVTRDTWLQIAAEVRAPSVEVEVVCSDPAEHRRRVDMRQADIQGHRLPTWDEVTGREYEPWLRSRIVVDTAGKAVEAALRDLLPRLNIRT